MKTKLKRFLMGALVFGVGWAVAALLTNYWLHGRMVYILYGFIGLLCLVAAVLICYLVGDFIDFVIFGNGD